MNRNIRQTQPSMIDNYRYLFRSAKLKWNKYGGKICTIAGTTGLILTGAHACRKTYRIHDQLKENGRRMSEARKKIDGEKKSHRIFRVAKEGAKCTLKTAKHYIPDIVVGAASGYLNAKGWQHEHHNYQKAATVVGVLAADFLNYRKNVIAEHGKEADRRYLTNKRVNEHILNGEQGDGEIQENPNAYSEEGITIKADDNLLKIWYSRETTPNVWHDSHVLREGQLNSITEELNRALIYGGMITVNDIRRCFYGRKGDRPEGAIFGRIWDPGNPEHPERGRMVNLHYEDDEDFMSGRTDSCWIIIEIDDEPLIESLKKRAPNI